MPSSPFSRSHAFALAALLAAGCGGSSSPEQQLADRHFETARAAFRQGQIRRTHAHLDSALALESTLHRPARVGEIHRLRGATFAALAEFDSAFSFYRRAIESFRGAADRPAARAVALDIADAEHVMGRDRRAWEQLDESLRLAGVFGEEAGERAIRWAMLPAARAIEDFEAEEKQRAALAKALGGEGDTRGTARLLREEGLALMARGRPEAALEPLRRAVQYAEQSGDSLDALSSMILLARCTAATGPGGGALQIYAEGLSRSDVTKGARRLREEMLFRVGNLYLANRQPGEAVRFYRAALNSAIRLRNRLGEGYAFAQLGHCALAGAGTTDEALKNFAAARDVFAGLSYAAGDSYARLGTAMAAERMGRVSEALEFYASAMELRAQCLWERPPDDLTRECEESALGSRSGAFAAPHLELLARTGKFEEAFSWAERMRARELGLKVLGMDLRSRDSALTSLLQTYARHRAAQRGAERVLAGALETAGTQAERLEAILRSLDRARRSAAAAAQEVALRSPALAPLVQPRGFTVQETQRALPRGSALLMFLPAQRSFFLYTVTPGGATARVSGADRAGVEAMCREYHEALRMRERYRDSLNVLQRAKDARIDELTTALHSLLVRPVEGDLTESSTLTVVAPPPLQGVPIHALRRTGGRRGSDYVIQDRAVTYLPSAFLLASTAPPALSAGADIFALGFQGGSGWDVEYELRDIRAFFKDVRLHFGAAATVDTLLRSRADILHLAAEFSASNLSSANAFCILSDGKAFNTSRRIPWERFFLLPPFPVAVVSDLGTGGATMHPEFPFLFLGGGTPTLVLQSYVPTRKTKKFFGEIFYTATLEGAPPRAAARQAVLEMIRTPEYSSPSLWAPFMIWGK